MVNVMKCLLKTKALKEELPLLLFKFIQVRVIIHGNQLLILKLEFFSNISQSLYTLHDVSKSSVVQALDYEMICMYDTPLVTHLEP